MRTKKKKLVPGFSW